MGRLWPSITWFMCWMGFDIMSGPVRRVTFNHKWLTDVSTLPSQSLSQSLKAYSNYALFSAVNPYFYIVYKLYKASLSEKDQIRTLVGVTMVDYGHSWLFFSKPCSDTFLNKGHLVKAWGLLYSSMPKATWLFLPGTENTQTTKK